MTFERAQYLVDSLIANTITAEELSELLLFIGEEKMDDRFSQALEKHFISLLDEHESSDVSYIPKKQE